MRARSLFALVMTGVPLSAQTPQQLRATQGALHHIVELSPGFAPAYVELGLLEWRLALLQEAFNDEQKAQQLEPWRPGYQVLSGHILLAGNQPALAAKIGRTQFCGRSVWKISQGCEGEETRLFAK